MPTLSSLFLSAAASGALHAPPQAPAPAETHLSAPERTLEHQFSQIRGIRELPDGRLLVTDRLEPALYAVSLADGSVRRIGREGSGPAEYRLPATLVALPGDSTLMVDEGNARLAFIGPDLVIHRAISSERPGMVFSLWPRAADSHGRLYFQVPRWASGPAGVEQDTVPIARIDLGTGRVDTLARVKGYTDTPGHVHYGLPNVPFSPEDTWQAGPDGRLTIVRSEDYHLEYRSPDGTVSHGPRIPFVPLPVTEADRIAYTRNFMENASMGGRGGKGGLPTGLTAVPNEMLQDRELKELAAKNSFATRKPAFTDAAPRLAPDGSLWVEASVPAGAPRKYNVFDSRGVLLQRVVFPAGRRLLLAGRMGLYVVAADEDGTEKLERYRRP
jgi:hypothetical protein